MPLPFASHIECVNISAVLDRSQRRFNIPTQSGDPQRLLRLFRAGEVFFNTSHRYIGMTTPMRGEALLVSNLSDPTYVELVIGTALNPMPDVFADQVAQAMVQHEAVAQTIRKRRLAATSNHPMPTTKKQLRNPKLYENAKKKNIK